MPLPWTCPKQAYDPSTSRGLLHGLPHVDASNEINWADILDREVPGCSHRCLGRCGHPLCGLRGVLGLLSAALLSHHSRGARLAQLDAHRQNVVQIERVRDSHRVVLRWEPRHVRRRWRCRIRSCLLSRRQRGVEAFVLNLGRACYPQRCSRPDASSRISHGRGARFLSQE